MAAGNINSQIASTTIRLGGSGYRACGKRSLYQLRVIPASSSWATPYLVQQGVFSQDIYPDNNQVVVRQQTSGFFVDARNTLGQAEITHSFQGYTRSGDSHPGGGKFKQPGSHGVRY